MRNRIIQGDSLTILKSWPDEFVDCVVTSPPYWGLRDYGIEGQLGLEKTPDEYVSKMVEVFREVRRVLKPEGTCWVNLGDSYAHSGACGGESPDGPRKPRATDKQAQEKMKYRVPPGLKTKDLCGIPWRVAFALQADGWVLRSEIIWAKKNCMPESCKDRPTKSHEQVFLFSKAKWVGPEVSKFHYISNEDARWLALLFDTEGNIVVKRSEMKSGRTTYGLQVAFANTSKELMERARDTVGAGSINVRPGKNAEVWYWQITNIQASELMKRIYHYLIVKKRQAQLGIYVQSLFETSRIERLSVHGRLRGRLRSENHTEMLEKCWATMKLLNHFGNPDLSWIPEPIFGHWDSQPYYFDQEAVREPHVRIWDEKNGGSMMTDWSVKSGGAMGHRNSKDDYPLPNPSGRNIRSVWTIATQPYPQAHFATFPEALVEPCVKAGTSEKGYCPVCGKPWVRVAEATGKYADALKKDTWSSGGLEKGNNKPAGYDSHSKETHTLG